MQKLEVAVAAAAATVTDWRAKIAKIEAQIAAENHAITIAKQQREQHALASTLSEPNAVAAIRTARVDQYESEQRLADVSIALPAARQHLDNAERAAAAARRELAMHQAQGMMRARVAAGARLDVGFAAIPEAYLEYDSLGRQLQSFPDLDLAQGGMSRWEDCAGLKRLAAAVPAFLKTLLSWTWTHHAKHVPLAESERQFWSLPPEQPDEKAKAAA